MIDKNKALLFSKTNNYITIRVFIHRNLKITTLIYSIKKSAKKRDIFYKNMLKKLKINGCSICEYNNYLDILEFHHVIPKNKLFNIRQSTMGRSNKKLVEELNKCILLCPNCHKEMHLKELIEI